MKMTKRILITVLFLLYFLHQGIAIDKREAKIKSYFEKIGININGKDKYYVILNLLDCSRCIDKNLNLLSKVKKKHKVNLIISYKYSFDENLLKDKIHNFKIFQDSIGLFSKYDICPNNSCLIIMKKNTLVSLLPFDNENMHNIEKILSDIN